MAEGVFQNAHTVAVKLVGHWPQEFGSCGDRPLNKRIHVVNLDDNIDRRRAMPGSRKFTSGNLSASTIGAKPIRNSV